MGRAMGSGLGVVLGVVKRCGQGWEFGIGIVGAGDPDREHGSFLLGAVCQGKGAFIGSLDHFERKGKGGKRKERGKEEKNRGKVRKLRLREERFCGSRRGPEQAGAEWGRHPMWKCVF